MNITKYNRSVEEDEFLHDFVFPYVFSVQPEEPKPIDFQIAISDFCYKNGCVIESHVIHDDYNRWLTENKKAEQYQIEQILTHRSELQDGS